MQNYKNSFSLNDRKMGKCTMYKKQGSPSALPLVLTANKYPTWKHLKEGHKLENLPHLFQVKKV